MNEVDKYRDLKNICRISDNNDVYLALNKENNKRVVRIISDDFLDLYLQLKEANVIGIPRIYYIDSYQNDKYVVVEEYIEGKSLFDYMKDTDLTIDEVIDISIKICNILSQTHRLNPPVIHKDIKSKNVIITEDKDIYLIDFGAGRVIKDDDQFQESDTELVGTDGFAAPEQYGFGVSDKRTDIYNLGRLINQMLTGQVSKNIDFVIIKNNPLTPIIEKCTRLDKNVRYKSVELLRDEIEDCINKYNKAIEFESDLNENLNDINKVIVEEHYCTNCGCGLDEQIGFSPNNETWICQKCGALMMNENAKAPNSTKYPNIYWYCDGCNSFLNIQDKFRDDKGIWKCTKCGYVNYIDEEHI